MSKEKNKLRMLPGCSAAGVLVLAFVMLGCSADSSASSAGAGFGGAAAKSAAATSLSVVLTDGDLEAYAKGLAKETALVRAAQERALNAKTPEARAQAAQEEWEDQTIPGGAQAAGMSVERYRSVRKMVNRVFETLDFQGKIAGPMEIDIEHASPEMKQRLANDPFAELTPASAAVLRAHMDKLVPVWIGYMNLTAVNG